MTIAIKSEVRFALDTPQANKLPLSVERDAKRGAYVLAYDIGQGEIVFTSPTLTGIGEEVGKVFAKALAQHFKEAA